MKRSPWIKATMKARKQLGIKKKFVLINGPSKLGKKLYTKSLSYYKRKSPKQHVKRKRSPRKKNTRKRRSPKRKRRSPKRK